MAVIKCKMCGGDLVLTEGSTIATCEFCGSQQTVPTADNEKKLTLFARANRLRMGCEFDKAAGVYESIVADFPEEAEAYWGLVLCKYGIEYVDDPATGKKIPTCHRSSFESIMDDSDLEQALENADILARKQYRDEAKQIEELRKGIIAVSANEQPYDIFICYKETDASGERTLDSVLAQDIYDALTAKNYRVFFSRITLEDKLGVEYEPYIFAALNSAKIMLAVGTDYEYYNAVWVKNEWSRYLKLLAKDKEKHLIPCFKGIDAYDMPKEFAKLQAQDLGKVGAMQDLLRGIDKILPKNQPVTVVQEKVVVGENTNTVPLLKRVFMFLEDGDWASANEYCERVLDIDPENAKAYLAKLMAELKVNKQEHLQEQRKPFDSNKYYQKAIRFADRELRQSLIGYIEQIKIRPVKETYKRAKDCFSKASAKGFNMDAANLYMEAAKLFRGISEYLDSADFAQMCYKTGADIIYHSAKNAMSEASTEYAYREAGKMFAQISDYKDCAQFVKQCEQMADKTCLEIENEKTARFNELVKQYNQLRKCEQDSSHLTDLQTEYQRLSEQKNCATELLHSVSTTVKSFHDTQSKIKATKMTIASLQEELDGCSFFAGKRKKAIASEISMRQNDLTMMLSQEKKLRQQMHEYTSPSEIEEKICNFDKQLSDLSREIAVSEEAIEKMKQDRETIIRRIVQTICDENLIDLVFVEKPKGLWERIFVYQINNGIQTGLKFGEYDGQPIEWLVLKKEAGKALVISKYALEARAYDTTSISATWVSCSLRKWLNVDFINAAFSDDEQTLISTEMVIDDESSMKSATQDKIFLLSFKEAHQYFSSNSARQCKPTNHAVAAGVSTSDIGTCCWWLRSSADWGREIRSVLANGSIGGTDSDNSKRAVRPAMWINLDN